MFKKTNKNSNNIYQDNFVKSQKNPFLEKCENCTADFWDKLKEQTEILNKKCAPNTYVWIEKFKDDNY